MWAHTASSLRGAQARDPVPERKWHVSLEVWAVYPTDNVRGGIQDRGRHKSNVMIVSKEESQRKSFVYLFEVSRTKGWLISTFWQSLLSWGRQPPTETSLPCDSRCFSLSGIAFFRDQSSLLLQRKKLGSKGKGWRSYNELTPAWTRARIPNYHLCLPIQATNRTSWEAHSRPSQNVASPQI